MNKVETALVNTEIAKLLDQKVIFFAPDFEPGQFVSTIFTRPKKDGGLRLILNLKKFNENVEYRKFKMDSLLSAVDLISPDMWMASVDLKSAYFSCPIALEHQKFLKFIWQGKTYKFAVLPNELACCPRRFTKLLKPVFAHLRNLGFYIVGLIDDLLILHEDRDKCLEGVQTTVDLLTKLGFIIHEQKSVLEPTQEITFLGFVLNSRTMQVTLDSSKTNNIKDICLKTLKSKKLTIHDLAVVTGKIISVFPAALYGQLHYRDLECLKINELRKQQSFRKDWDAICTLNEGARNELRWWVENIENIAKPMFIPPPEVTIFTDASSRGWGAFLYGVHANGRFSEAEAPLSINTKECLAIMYGLRSFTDRLKGCNVLVQTDNTTAVSVVSKFGTVQSDLRNKISRQIWSWAIENSVWVQVTHIPGLLNVEADWASRNFNERTEWELNQSVFDQINAELGPCYIDLMATNLNKKLARYVSWFPDPGSFHVDAFTLNWKELNRCYCFPPFRMIPRILQKIRMERVEMVLVVPEWPTQTWFPQLWNMTVMEPVWIRNCPLTLPWDRTLEHPLQMTLLAVRISGIS